MGKMHVTQCTQRNARSAMHAAQCTQLDARRAMHDGGMLILLIFFSFFSRFLTINYFRSRDKKEDIDRK